MRSTVLAAAVLAAGASTATGATVTKTGMPAGIAGFPGAGPGLGVHEALTPDFPDAVREVGTYAVTVEATAPAEAPYAGATKAYAVDDVTHHTDTGVGYPMELQLAENAWAGEYTPDVAQKLTWLLRNAESLIAGEADTARAAAAVQVVVWQTLRNPPTLLPRADLNLPTVDGEVNALAVKFTDVMLAGYTTPHPAPGIAALTITAGPLTGCSTTLSLTGTPGGVVTLTVDNSGALSTQTVTLAADGSGTSTVTGVPGATVSVAGSIATGGVLVRADIQGPALLDDHVATSHESEAPEELIFIAGAAATAARTPIACSAPPAPPVVTAVGQPTGPGALSVTKTGAVRARAGSVVTYRVRIRNMSTVATNDVVLRDILPSGLSLVSKPAGATVKNGVVSWRIGTLASGASRTINVRLRVDRNTTGRRCNVAEASAANAATVRARACTSIRAVAGIVRVPPPVTG